MASPQERRIGTHKGVCHGRPPLSFGRKQRRKSHISGAGNDAIVYDIKDSKLDGGEGIDFVLANDSDLTMDKLLNGWGGS